MCNQKSPPPDHDVPVQSSSMIHDIIKEEDEEEEETLKPLLLARKSRTKTRKPKFLSLRSKVIPKDTKHQNHRVPNSSSSAVKKTNTKTMTAATTTRNLFPLHPETYQERGEMHDDNVALLFHSDGGATLNGLLTSTSAAATTTTTSATMSSDREDQESFSTYAYYRGTQEFVRTAMRRREREVVSVEEKWVCFAELVEKKEVESVEDCLTSSTSSVHGGGDDQIIDQRCRLALKLDYQEILNAWSDKGPLYIDGDEPQTVPDLLLQDLQPFDQLHESSTLTGSAGNLWRVPGEDVSLKTKMEQREASVLRYKEKRQNRLFAKRIRYQVRKLNAEKRPRMKGRFVKSS